MRPSFYDHLHPPTIPAPQARWRYTLGAGGLAVFLTLVVGFTGILVTFYYLPTPEQAANSVQQLTFLVQAIFFTKQLLEGEKEFDE